MDRSPEGTEPESPPENSPIDRQIDAHSEPHSELSHAGRSDANRSENTDSPTHRSHKIANRNDSDRGDSDRGDADRDDVVDANVEHYGGGDGEPIRKLIFHRFDPQSERIRPHHLETELDDPALRATPFQTTPLRSTPTDVGNDRPEPRAMGEDEITLIDESDVVDELADDRLVVAPRAPLIEPRERPVPQRSDPLRHGVVMLGTVCLMLAAARFVLPGIVEEIRYAQHRGQLRAEFEVARGGLQDVSLDTLSQAYQMVSAAAGPSVVHIDIRRSSEAPLVHAEFPGAPSILISDQGSGVVIDAQGYILTNRHVIAGSDEISVTVSDGRELIATVIGTDEVTDLAVIKVDANDLIPIPWGDSDSIRVGSPVWAIGSPFGLDRTVTFGILSGKHRIVRAKDRYQDFMQSDVAVNPGNSGGALVDSRGTLIGINTAIVGDTYQGVSFAIPSTVARKIYNQLREKGAIERGWLGVSLAEVPPEKIRGNNLRVRGAMIVALADQRSGAARAGLQPGDLVLQVDGEIVRDVDHLMQVIGNAMAGTKINLAILRGEQELSLDVVLGRRPPQLDRR